MQIGEAEDAPDNARDLERELLGGAKLVDATQDQAVEARRQVQRIQRGHVVRIDPPVVQIIEKLLHIEWVALRTAVNTFDEERRHDARTLREELRELGADGLLRLHGVQLGEAELGEVLQSLQADKSAPRRVGIGWTIGQQDKDWQVLDRACSEFEEIKGYRVDPMQILQNEEEAGSFLGSLAGSGLQTLDQHCFKLGLAIFRL